MAALAITGEIVAEVGHNHDEAHSAGRANAYLS
jgi:hypothetical protein